MKKNIILASILVLSASCNDKMFSKTKEVVTTPAITPPTTSPSDFKGVKAVSNITDTTATLTWDEASDAGTYTIFLVTPNTKPVVKEVVKAPASSVVLTGLTPNTKYETFVRMMDTSSLIDDQFNAIEFTTSNETSFTNETSLQFRGNESIKLKNSFEMFSHPQKFAISLWFKTNVPIKTDIRLVSLHRSFGPSENLGVGIENGKLFLTYLTSDGTSKKYVTTSVVSDGLWHNIVLNVNVDKVDLYLDNVEAHKSVNIISSFGHHNAFIASLTGYQKGYEGQMDEVSFWNGPLTDSERSSIFSNVKTLNLKKVNSNLALWLRMGDDQGDLASGLIDQVSGQKFTAYGLDPSDYLNQTP